MTKKTKGKNVAIKFEVFFFFFNFIILFYFKFTFCVFGLFVAYGLTIFFVITSFWGS